MSSANVGEAGLAFDVVTNTLQNNPNRRLRTLRKQVRLMFQSRQSVDIELSSHATEAER